MSFDLLADGVVRIDLHGFIREMNEAAAEMTGHSPRRQVGRPAHEVLLPRDATGQPVLQEGWSTFSRLPGVGRLVEQTVLLRCADGSDLKVRLTAKVRRDSRGRLEELVTSFRPAAASARQQADPTGLAVIPMVSHELRSPLTAIKGYTALLMSRWDSFSDEDKQMMLGQISSGCDRVTRLITELLEVSRIEEGHLPLQKQLIEVPDLVREAVDSVRREYPDLDVKLDFPVITPRALVDPDKIKQVMINLVENACKYASPTGIRIQGTFEDESMTITVEDSGSASTELLSDRVFSKFYRNANSKPSGCGLGLWIGKGIVESHGGVMGVETVDGGARFRVQLPLDTPMDVS